LVRASSIAAKSWEATFSSPTTTKPDARFSIRVTPQCILVISDMDKSLTINIDVTAMKELLRLAQTNEPLWIKTDGCLDVLSLKSYENAFPRLMTLVEMLMDSVKAREIFPSVVAASKILGVVSSKIAWKSRRCLTFDNNMI
ncbi:hypothetical protein HID58_074041, partial [Brassica napus]